MGEVEQFCVPAAANGKRLQAGGCGRLRMGDGRLQLQQDGRCGRRGRLGLIRLVVCMAVDIASY